MTAKRARPLAGPGIPAQRRSWAPILDEAARIVRAYDIPVTLRQLHYRLMSAEVGGYGTLKKDYDELSSKTADLRRKHRFPKLYDRGRKIEQPYSCDDAVDYIGGSEYLRLDRTEGQTHQIWLGVEKNALAGLICSWFDDLGLPVVPLGGYSSESLDRVVRSRVQADGRPAVLIIGGDFDPSGMDITRNFIEQTGCWDEMVRIGLHAEQVDELDLPVLVGKRDDSRARAFIASNADFHERHGLPPDTPAQVELDAVEPLLLRDWLQAEIDHWWDPDAYADVLNREEAEREDVDAAKQWLVNRRTERNAQ